MKITVYGASSSELDEIYYEAAFKFGEAMARRGHAMVYGGGASGLMGAAARGMSARQGQLIGVAPKFFDEPGVLYKDNTDMIFTDTMSQRKEKMEELGEAFAILPGGIGTFEEFFETLTLKQLGVHGKAMAMLNINGCYDALNDAIQKSVAERFTPSVSRELYKVFMEIVPMLDYLESYAGKPENIWKTKLFNQQAK